MNLQLSKGEMAKIYQVRLVLSAMDKVQESKND